MQTLLARTLTVLLLAGLGLSTLAVGEAAAGPAAHSSGAWVVPCNNRGDHCPHNHPR